MPDRQEWSWTQLYQLDGSRWSPLCPNMIYNVGSLNLYTGGSPVTSLTCQWFIHSSYTDYTVVPIYGVYIVPYFWEWKHDPTLWLPVIYATLLLKSGLVASSAAVLCQGFAHSDLDRRLETTLASLPWKTHRFKMFCTERWICFPLFPMSHVLSLHGHMCFSLNMSWVVLTAS